MDRCGVFFVPIYVYLIWLWAGSMQPMGMSVGDRIFYGLKPAVCHCGEAVIRLARPEEHDTDGPGSNCIHW
jgi:hypothetical protein